MLQLSFKSAPMAVLPTVRRSAKRKLFFDMSDSQEGQTTSQTAENEPPNSPKDLRSETQISSDPDLSSSTSNRETSFIPVHELLRQDQERMQEKYNFDFQTDSALPGGRYEWTKIPESDVPQFYATPKPEIGPPKKRSRSERESLNLSRTPPSGTSRSCPNSGNPEADPNSGTAPSGSNDSVPNPENPGKGSKMPGRGESGPTPNCPVPKSGTTSDSPSTSSGVRRRLIVETTAMETPKKQKLDNDETAEK